MSELPQLVSDLALILIVAGITTIIFKRLRQPLVLGYILAGFLAGPYMPYMPSVAESKTIEVWSEIGVIFLMFSLGLEFSFKKILKGGISPIIAACFSMTAMFCIGCGAGYLLNWSFINCVFLGGILTVSSTTIIYKAFDDLGLMNRHFATKVMAVLILEDILGIVIMVILSAVAISNKFEGSELIFSLLKLLFFLLLWFVVGMWIIPTFLHRNRSFINKETLVIVSIGLCFLMVVVADSVGYSTALGAFMMGSILAETIEAERIDSAISPIKDLFGAIFFVSVGMMVSPADLVAHWLPILVLVISILLGKAIFGTMGYLLSGSSRSDAMMSGFSMAQIGEFSFIIAALGESLKVTDGMLMPIVVATSIITTFLTPYMIKLAGYINSKEQKKQSKKDKSQNVKVKEGKVTAFLASHASFTAFIKKVLLQTTIYGVLSVAVISLLFVSLLLVCRHFFGHWLGNAVCGVLVLLLLAPLLRPIIMKNNMSEEANELRSRGRMYAILINLTVFFRFAFATAVVYYVLDFLSPFRWYFHIAVAIGIVLLMIRSRWIRKISMNMENTFVENLTRRENNGPAYARQLRGKDLHIARLTLPEGSTWVGKTLAQLHIGDKTGVHVAAIVRNHHHINIPGGSNMLFPHDVLEVVGNDRSIEKFSQRMNTEVQNIDQNEGDKMELVCIEVKENTLFEGILIKDSGIRDKYHCMVVGVENKEGNVRACNAEYQITHGDRLWLVGSHDEIVKVKKLLTKAEVININK